MSARANPLNAARRHADRDQLAAALHRDGVSGAPAEEQQAGAKGPAIVRGKPMSADSQA